MEPRQHNDFLKPNIEISLIFYSKIWIILCDQKIILKWRLSYDGRTWNQAPFQGSVCRVKEMETRDWLYTPLDKPMILFHGFS
jgi:hypothetical protein